MIKNNKKTPALLAALLLASPIWAGDDDHEHEYKKCSSTTSECIAEMVDGLSERGWIGIEWDGEKEGMPVLTRIVSESPAERAGLEKGDQLLAFNGVSTKEGQEAVWAEAKKSLVPGNTVTLTVNRNGEKKAIPVKLVPIPRSVVAQWIGNHVLDHHLAEQVSEDEDAPSPRP